MMKKRILMITCLVFLTSNHLTLATEKSSRIKKKDVTMTILYDNYVFAKGLKTDWGFSCILKGTEKTILFDTGTKGDLLLENFEKLKVNPNDVDIVVISHNHRDHIGGLLTFLKKNNEVLIYLPPSCSAQYIRQVEATEAKVVTTKAPLEICKDVHLTGPMGAQVIEQSMILDTAEGTIVITGCAHPGIVEIVRKSKAILPKDVHLAFGGFHLPRKPEVELRQIINEFRKLGVEKVGATHCTGDRAIQMFKQEYGPNFVQIGVGRTLKIEALPN